MVTETVRNITEGGKINLEVIPRCAQGSRASTEVNESSLLKDGSVILRAFSTMPSCCYGVAM